MTIEEKAKAYDEALEIARRYRDNARAIEEYATATRYEIIFPELRKKEKPLTPFQQCLNCILRGVYYAEVPNKKVNEFILNVVRTRTDELIKLAKRHEDTDCQLRESEDERIRKEIIDFLETIPASELKRIPRPISEWFAWLEKQKEQKPVEWSEVDSIMLDSIIAVIEEWESNQSEKEKEYYGATPKADWLESLRPQPHWKPTEEQISSLKQARDYYMSGRIKYVGQHLSEIAEQLEKL